MSQATAAICAAPLRSEAFVEDLYEPDAASSAEAPWQLRDAGLAALLCAVPVAVAMLGSVASVAGAL